jgi:ssRNA-specific RNase YbeY (16S rRNA maturation enzyme)
MVHGILHLMGYQDKTKAERQEMRKKEEECITMFHVEHN